VEPLLRLDLPHRRRGPKYDFLTDALRREAGIVDTDAVSEHNYDGYALKLIDECSDGLVLDCGAGRRPVYYSNVVNFEIVDYPSTDVLGVGEELPFKDGSFDAVISVSVLEHVRDPFRCAAEIVRVLKPGGRLLCCVPFLQPLHGYPHHYYNMTGQGLRALFDRHLQIDDHRVIDTGLPIWALGWIVKSWADGLSGEVKDEFLSMPLRELLKWPDGFIPRSWVQGLSSEKNFELAASTLLFARKP
jgi:SAM-dependent methyltransferase